MTQSGCCPVRLTVHVWVIDAVCPCLQKNDIIGSNLRQSFRQDVTSRTTSNDQIVHLCPGLSIGGNSNARSSQGPYPDSKGEMVTHICVGISIEVA